MPDMQLQVVNTYRVVVSLNDNFKRWRRGTMANGVASLDPFIEMDRRAFSVYLAIGVVILAAAGVVLYVTFTAPAAGGTPDLILKSAGFVVAIMSGLPFERCLARHERVSTLRLLKQRSDQLAADPNSSGPDAEWVKGMIDKIYEKRSLG